MKYTIFVMTFLDRAVINDNWSSKARVNVYYTLLHELSQEHMTNGLSVSSLSIQLFIHRQGVAIDNIKLYISRQTESQHTNNYLGPLLLTWINFNPCMDKKIQPL